MNKVRQIKVLKSLYSKQAILYTIWIYLDENVYSINEDDKNYIIDFSNMGEEDLNFIKKELSFNSLRFEIADNNKEIRKTIITQALWSINMD